MNIKKFNIKNHNPRELAELKFSVDPETFLKIFKSKQKAILAIEQLIEVENSRISQSSRNSTETFVLTENNADNDDNRNNEEVFGFFQILKGNKKSFLHEIIFILKNLKIDLALKFIYIEILDYLVLSKFDEGDLYLAEVAISKNKQGKGYGKHLLNKTIEIAKKEGFKRVILDVELDNTKAREVYEKFGFKIFNKRTDKIFNKERGMYNMEYIL